MSKVSNGKMAEEIKSQISGTWIHSKDDDLAPFFNVVGKLTVFLYTP